VVTITYFSIVVGELIPKRIAQTYPELMARLISRPITLLALATRPFVHLLSRSTEPNCCSRFWPFRKSVKRTSPKKRFTRCSRRAPSLACSNRRSGR
jgi:hypothetical protein